MSGYWADAEENPFNMMSWTRGGGGYNNSLTAESNERRADAMTGVDALPRFATMGVAQAALPSKSLAVVGDNLIRTSGPGSSTSRTAKPGQGGSGAGVAVAETVPRGGGAGAGSQFVINAPGYGYKDGFSPGVIDWQTPLQFTDAPEISGIENVPLERVGIGGPQEAPGAISDIGWIATTTGGFQVTPSNDAKERIEDDAIQQFSWAWRNQLAPGVGLRAHPYPDFLEPGAYHMDFWSGEWRAGSQQAVDDANKQSFSRRLWPGGL